MRVFQINAVPYGSTGRIMVQIAQLLEQQGHDALCTTGFTWEKCTYDKHFITSGLITKTWHTYLARFTGLNGCFSVMATRRLLRRLEAFKPDVIHLHNLHCWYVNLPMLFGYIKKHDIPVVWTFHDCWPITGHCPILPFPAAKNGKPAAITAAATVVIPVVCLTTPRPCGAERKNGLPA